MLARREATKGVLSVMVTGRLTEKEVEAAIGWIDEALAAHAPLHVFVEVKAWSGLDPSAVVQGWLKGAHLLSQLRRFGRVAIVSEQRWVRVLVRLESAILPGISYRVFEPQDHDRALAWVCGQSAD